MYAESLSLACLLATVFVQLHDRPRGRLLIFWYDGVFVVGICRAFQDERKDGGTGDDGEGGEYISRNARLMLMLEDELPNCHNQERVDEFAVRFL